MGWKGISRSFVGNDIPISAQLVGVVDVYDALVNKRIYKAAYTHDDAARMIEAGECGVFSPLALECFGMAEKEFRNVEI